MRGAASGLAMLALLASAACAPPGTVGALDDAALRALDDLQLCAAWHTADARQRPRLEAEIGRRGLLTAEEWSSVVQSAIFVGMSACGLLAARGDPRPAGAIERLGVRTGPYLQWVYRTGRAPPLYIYTDNGRIIGWQQ